MSSISEQTASEQAAAFFAQRPKQYNCAQAVAQTFGRDDLLKQLKSCGGGKAPDGVCGALYAAMLLADEDQRESVKEQFLKEAGYLECKAIRQNGQTPCAGCVRCAAGILAKIQDKNRQQ
ncbi:hypothetical protein FACS18942_03600 [Planctomycetales bacterium]|nr:hypothetical protein FACS18942_03600 [Planctomycetales bacterium]